MEDHHDGGQLLPLVALTIAVCGIAALGIGRLGLAAAEHAAAQTAADAAALAAAHDGDAAARTYARANGGELVRVERLGNGDVRVDVTHGGASASARARLRGNAGGADQSARADLAPAMRAALTRAEQLLGAPVPVTPAATAPGGRFSIDVEPGFAERLAAVAADAGLCRPQPTAEPARFELCRARFAVGRGG